MSRHSFSLYRAFTYECLIHCFACSRSCQKPRWAKTNTLQIIFSFSLPCRDDNVNTDLPLLNHTRFRNPFFAFLFVVAKLTLKCQRARKSVDCKKMKRLLNLWGHHSYIFAIAFQSFFFLSDDLITSCSFLEPMTMTALCTPKTRDGPMRLHGTNCDMSSLAKEGQAEGEKADQISLMTTNE